MAPRLDPRRWFRLSTALAVIALAFVAATSAQQQRRGGGGGFFGGFGMGYEPTIRNVKYDGRFTFVRLKYTVGPNGYYYHGMPSWAHGFIPIQSTGDDVAEESLMKILDAISDVHPRLDGTNVLGIDDPDIFQYPISYMTEAGFWELSDKEALAFRAYLQKGGFLIFDDFRPPGRAPVGGGWDQFETNMHRILPGAQIMDMTPDDQIFHVFFDINTFKILPQAYDGGAPILRGIFQDNDRNKRLMAMINFNTDVSQFWEFSNTGFSPIADANEAYELGVNYIIYGLTH